MLPSDLKPTRRHRRRLAPIATMLLALCACSDREFRSPTAPPADPAPTPTIDAVYSADHTVMVDTATAACGWPSSPASLFWPYWHAVAFDDSIRFEDDWEPISALIFDGMLRAGEFVTKTVEPTFPVAPCHFRQAWLSGRFAEDLSSFEAYLTFVYGPANNPKTVEWRVSARRSPT